MLTFFLGILIIAGCVAFLYGLFFVAPRLKLQRAFAMQLFLITLPKDAGRVSEEQGSKNQRSWQEEVSVMEQFYTGIAALRTRSSLARIFLGEPHVTLEIALPVVGEEISFYIAVPRFLASQVEKQLHGFFPHASIEPAEDYNIFNPRGGHAGSSLRLARSFYLPFRTYREMEADPLNVIAGALSKLQERGDGAAIQILMRPVSSATEKRKRARKIAQLMQEGREFRSARHEVEEWFLKLLQQTVSAAAPAKKKQEEELRGTTKEVPAYAREHKPVTPFQEELIKALETKASRALLAVQVRLVASAESRERAEAILAHLEAAFSQFEAPQRNALRPARKRGWFLSPFIFDFSFRMFSSRDSMVLSTEEAASLFHMPIWTVETPRVKFLKAKPAPAPANLPKEGALLGENVFRGERSPARLSAEDRRRHLYIIGQTGTGKTTLLANLIRQDIEEGHGVGVIDPHGDLAESVLGMVPESRAEDVVYFDPSDMERPMGLNMLEWETPEERDFAVQEMIAIFMKLFPPEVIGPMFEHNMRNAMLTIAAKREEPGTIVEIPIIFTDEKYARAKLPYVTDPLVRSFWEKEMAKTTEFHKSEMLGYLISKIGRFVENEMMRNIIGQPRSGFNLRRVMDERKIFIANLSKGKTGEVNAALLGLILVSKMQMAAMSRADMPEEQRADFYLYIDEFQNFVTDSIATILSEARKYRLNLTLAHQFIGQLPESIRNAVFGNVGSLVAFRIGAQDAEFLVKQFEPVFNVQDLVNIHNFNAYVKLIVHGETSRAFNVEILPPAASRAEVTAAMRTLSRLRFGVPRATVENQIMERLRLGERASVDASPIPGERNL